MVHFVLVDGAYQNAIALQKTTSEMKADVNYFPKQPNSFVTNISIPQCDIAIPVEAVVK